MPAWLRDRRDAVLERLRERSEHTLKEDIHGHYRQHPQNRVLTQTYR